MSCLEIFGPRNFAKFSAMLDTLHLTDVHLNTSEFDVPTTVAARSKAWTVLASSNTGIVGSNSTQSMDVRVRLFCLRCPV
jgi:hypothetical protein